jgi:hypothetical protein
MEVGMMEAGFSNKDLGVGGVIVVSAWLTHKDNGALLVLSLEDNNFFADGGKALEAGLKDNQVITELNPSSNFLGRVSDGNSDTLGVIALADAIPSMGALSVLSL